MENEKQKSSKTIHHKYKQKKNQFYPDGAHRKSCKRKEELKGGHIKKIKRK